MQDRKITPHYLCSEIVSIVRLSGRRRMPALDGNLEEIGARRAVILLQDPLPKGMRIRVEVKGCQLVGAVKSCKVDRLLGCFIEIQLESQSQWSEKWFVPQHLFRLCPCLRYFTQEKPKVTEKICPLGTGKFTYRNAMTVAGASVPAGSHGTRRTKKKRSEQSLPNRDRSGSMRFSAASPATLAAFN